MDFTKLINSDLVKELDSATDKSISREDISKVLAAAMPSIMENLNAAKEDEAPTRGTSRGNSAASLLFSLLGDNSSNVTQSVAESTGVSSSNVASILTSAAPLLLKFLMGGSSDSSASSNSGGLDGISSLMSLLGGKKDEKEDAQDEEKNDKKDDGNSLGSILNMAATLLGSK